LWNSGGFTRETDAFWLSGNTLRTVILYMLAAALEDSGEFFIANALANFEKTVPFDATDQQLKNLSQDGPWLDDFGWWAIAFMLAARNSSALGLDATTCNRLVTGAIHCWKIMGFGWDTANTPPVPGGVWNTQQVPRVALEGRSCVTNEVYWLTSLQLAAFTNDPSYLDPNKDSTKFFGDANDQNLLFIQVQSRFWLVCETFDEVALGFGKPGWFWAGDQGLFSPVAAGHVLPTIVFSTQTWRGK
jgi:hypothetical protein